MLGRAGQHHSRPQRLKPTTGAGRAKTRPQHGRCSGRVASVASIAMRGSVQRRSRSEQISVASTRFSSMLATTSGRRAGFSRFAGQGVPGGAANVYRTKVSFKTLRLRHTSNTAPERPTAPGGVAVATGSLQPLGKHERKQRGPHLYCRCERYREICRSPCL